MTPELLSNARDPSIPSKTKRPGLGFVVSREDGFAKDGAEGGWGESSVGALDMFDQSQEAAVKDEKSRLEADYRSLVNALRLFML
ncbi:MAG: hypothetical protein M1831_004727 [Alyxoria varia]|nr:MAG: hypothetical protein M1831_004727 [Alyxoria varia]